MPRSKTVTLGGVKYEIQQLPMRANREWRERLSAPVTGLITMLQQYGNLQINSAGDLAEIMMFLKDVVVGSMTMLMDALFDYSPALAKDRERIEAEAYDDEAVRALGVVLSLAYPLDQVLTIFRGSPAIATSTNLPSPNGGSGTKSPTTARRKTT